MPSLGATIDVRDCRSSCFSMASVTSPGKQGGMHLRIVLGLAALALASCRTSTANPGSQIPGKPVETNPPEASGLKPAFAGQTRAPYRSAGVAFDVERVATGLQHPWGLAFLPDGHLLVTERPGRLRVIAPGGSKSEPVAGVPRVAVGGQGGLLDVALDPAFAQNQLVYVSYSEPREGGNGTAVARGRLVREGKAPRLDNVTVIWRMQPTLGSSLHFGSRLVFARDGKLFITTGERSNLEGRRQAQRLDSHFGKIIRIEPDGKVPKDNPFVGRAGALPDIYSYGHRNMQAAALHPDTGQLWVVDHGPRGGDEVNAVAAGKDYGWPTITYGIEYSGATIGEGKTAAPNMEQPLYYWDPVIAPSGMAFYTGDVFPAWKGSLFVGGLAGQHVARLTLEGNRIVGEERLLARRARFRDVRQGPDGSIYLLTDATDGEVLKLVPGKAAPAKK
jgi:glucose/arabinose dehydrogenase